MSLAQPNRSHRGKRALLKAGAALLAALCVVGLLMSAVARVQDAADRQH
jgi:hypothetical protein